MENHKRLRPASIDLSSVITSSSTLDSPTREPYHQILKLNEDARRGNNGNSSGCCCIAKEFLCKQRCCFVAVLTGLREDELKQCLDWFIPKIDLRSSLR